MQREILKYLHDIQESINSIYEYLGDKRDFCSINTVFRTVFLYIGQRKFFYEILRRVKCVFLLFNVLLISILRGTV